MDIIYIHGFDMLLARRIRRVGFSLPLSDELRSRRLSETFVGRYCRPLLLADAAPFPP